MLHLLSVIGISLLFLYLFHNFQNKEIFMSKKWPMVPRYRGTMNHWVGHNKYIETLLIWLHLIFIYLILQINKNIISYL